MFDNRTAYRQHHQKNGLASFDITVKETNLNIQADSNLSKQAIQAVLTCRNQIETYIAYHPEFKTAYHPLHKDPMAPQLIQTMINAGIQADVGPMAAVAGAVAEYTGRCLLDLTDEVVVENGGDIFIKSDTDTIFGIHVSTSSLYAHMGIQVKKRSHAYGICTSSGTLGHSKSFGTADAATVLAASCPLADAVATAMGNKVKRSADIQDAIDWAKSIPGVEGLIIIKNDHIGLWGGINLVRLTG